MDDPSNDQASPSAASTVEGLVSELRARVEQRRRAGVYPPGLEEDLSEHFRRILGQRTEAVAPPDMRGPLAAAERALPLEASRIPTDSAVPGGQTVHHAIARIVGRQTQGVLEQVQGFAQPMWEALSAVVTALEDLSRAVNVDVARHLDAIYERQAAHERAIAAGSGRIGFAPRDAGTEPARPGFPAERFEEVFGASRPGLVERYRAIGERLRDCAPVLDVGCGRGDLLEVLRHLGVEASGVEIDGELAKLAATRGLAVEHGEGLRALRQLEDGSLGGLALIQVVEHLPAQDLVELVALAADKLRPGGRFLLEAVNPQSLYSHAHALYLDPRHVRPVHAAYVSFLLREAGFSDVEVEWHSTPPPGEVLEPVDAGGDGTAFTAAYNANVYRLNRLLFAPQDYLVTAVR